MMTNNENLSSNWRFLYLGPNLKICHIDVEGISISKSEYLAHIMRKVDIIAVQETYTEENLRRRGTMYLLG
jgi:hypothetical protein